jgi:hypothetical protein
MVDKSFSLGTPVQIFEDEQYSRVALLSIRGVINLLKTPVDNFLNLGYYRKPKQLKN